MGLKKGQTNNAAGRPPGTPNKTTAEMRSWVSDLLGKNLKKLESDFNNLESKERFLIAEKLLQYVVPKQQAISAQIDLNRLSDEQLDMIINELTSNLSDGETD